MYVGEFHLITQSSFRFGKEAFFVLARKSRDCAEAYLCTPHKKPRRLTQLGRKRTLSGRKLVTLGVFANELSRHFRAGACRIMSYCAVCLMLLAIASGRMWPAGFLGVDSAEKDHWLLLLTALRFGDCTLKWGNYDNHEDVAFESGIVCPGIRLILLKC